MADAYHYSVYGDYGRSLPRDLDGYVHLTAAGWLAAPMDTAGEPMTAEQAEALAEQARAATREAEAAVAAWRESSDADEALAVAGLVCGRNVEEDASGGQGHCWRLVRGDELPASIREEIEAEMIDGGVDSTDDYMAMNGCHYRW
jgi:hypothetical protein